MSKFAVPADTRGTFQLTKWAREPVDVIYGVPPTANPRNPPLVVMHGVGRNASSYFETAWEVAKHFGYVVLCPHFPAELFPNGDGYQCGSVLIKGVKQARDRWLFALLGDQLLPAAREALGLTATFFDIWGHSAGGQFTHRLLYWCPENIRFAAPANPGWYTMPDLAVHWPYGLEGTGLDQTTLGKYASHRAVLVLGDQDVKTDDPNLRHTKDADAQGSTRWERGHKFMQTVSALEGATWELKVVPGASHSARQMMEESIKTIFAMCPGRSWQVLTTPGASVRAGPGMKYDKLGQLLTATVQEISHQFCDGNLWIQHSEGWSCTYSNKKRMGFLARLDFEVSDETDIREDIAELSDTSVDLACHDMTESERSSNEEEDLRVEVDAETEEKIAEQWECMRARNLRNGPGEEYNKVGKVHQGDVVVCNAKEEASNGGTWIRVEASSSRPSGWCCAVSSSGKASLVQI